MPEYALLDYNARHTYDLWDVYGAKAPTILYSDMALQYFVRERTGNFRRDRGRHNCLRIVSIIRRTQGCTKIALLLEVVYTY